MRRNNIRKNIGKSWKEGFTIYPLETEDYYLSNVTIYPSIMSKCISLYDYNFLNKENVTKEEEQEIYKWIKENKEKLKLNLPKDFKLEDLKLLPLWNKFNLAKIIDYLFNDCDSITRDQFINKYYSKPFTIN